jgi:hypothetical protein
MIRFFIIQNIDAIISTIGGIICTWFGYQAANKGDNSVRTKLLKILGPCVIGFGILQFIIGAISSVEWRRIATPDGVASVEYPGLPKANDQTQTLNGQTVRAIGWIYAVPGKDISLRISYSDAAVTESSIPADQRFIFLKQFLSKQGFVVLKEEKIKFGNAAGYSLQMEHTESKAIVWMRVSYVGNCIYRAVGSCGASFREDPVISKFVDSFKISSSSTH